jgi:hypothetical protein
MGRWQLPQGLDESCNCKGGVTCSEDAVQHMDGSAQLQALLGLLACRAAGACSACAQSWGGAWQRRAVLCCRDDLRISLRHRSEPESACACHILHHAHVSCSVLMHVPEGSKYTWTLTSPLALEIPEGQDRHRCAAPLAVHSALSCAAASSRALPGLLTPRALATHTLVQAPLCSRLTAGFDAAKQLKEGSPHLRAPRIWL